MNVNGVYHMGVEHYKKIAIDMLFRKSYGGYEGCEFGEDHFGKYFLFHYPGYDYNNLYYEKDIMLDEWDEISGAFSVNNFKAEREDTIIFIDNKYYIMDYTRYYKSPIIKSSGGRRSKGTHIGDEMFFYTDDEDGREKQHTIKTKTGMMRFLKKMGAREERF